MAFAKASDLIELAKAASQGDGVSLEWISARFSVSHRTAQRMTQSLEDTFESVTIMTDSQRRRLWKITGEVRLRGQKPLVVQVGPMQDAGILAQLLMAAENQQCIEVKQLSGKSRLWEPYGVLQTPAGSGLVGHTEKGWRILPLTRIASVNVLEERYTPVDEFSLEDFAAQGFGLEQDEAEYGEVIWLFAPEVAQTAASWRFHPRQTLLWHNTGALEVRFVASGYREMAEFLAPWGEMVEVLAPKALKKLLKKKKI